MPALGIEGIVAPVADEALRDRCRGERIELPVDLVLGDFRNVSVVLAQRRVE